jgi:signal transduction histidine kinase
MLRGLASRVKRGQPATAADLDELVALVNGAIESTRSLARGLSPVQLERGGLVYALRALVVRARELYGLEVKFRSRVWPELTLDAAATTHLYRIAQEALTNAARHAGATQISIALNARGRMVTLTVTDDGAGLQDEPGNGMGLRIMRYRAQMMGGELDIAPAEPRGTRVTCRVAQRETAAGAGR